MMYEKINKEEKKSQEKHEQISQILGVESIVFHGPAYDISDIKLEDNAEIMGRYYDGEDYLLAVKDTMYDCAGIYCVYLARHAQDEEEKTELEIEETEVDVEDIKDTVLDIKEEIKGEEIKEGVKFVGAGEKAIKFEMNNQYEFIKYDELNKYPEIVEFINQHNTEEENEPAVDTAEIKAVFKKAGKGHQTSQGTIDEILPSAIVIGGYRHSYSSAEAIQIAEEIEGGI